MSKFPKKLFIEVTSRCNLHCSMCVKRSKGSKIIDGDMSLSTFNSLEPALESAEVIVLNGIGEPLLNPDLEKFIQTCKEKIQSPGWVGFQSNATLLTYTRARSLLEAGLDRICISIDSLNHDSFGSLRQGGKLETVDQAFDNLNQAIHDLGRSDFRSGIEFVAMPENINELPQVIKFAQQKQVSFIIITHLLPYSKASHEKTLFNTNSDRAVELFKIYDKKAASEGLDLKDYFNILWKINKTDDDIRIIDFISKMKQDGRSKNISFNLKNLMNINWEQIDKTKKIFNKSQKLADEYGIQINIPSIFAKYDRYCDFIEDKSAFISYNGNVHPCYFLWHRYSCFLDGDIKFISEKIFGNVDEEPLGSIWSESFKDFRNEVLSYDYPHCSDCPMGPCEDISGKNYDFEHDCYGIKLLCGHCPWCMGGFQCLR